ncbi:MAG: hypothetical protein ACXW02_06295 [Halobacteriota archaeon]
MTNGNRKVKKSRTNGSYGAKCNMDKSCHQFSQESRHPHETARFIGQLQNSNGGFRRAAASGISSLENAFYVLKALMELTSWVG